MVVFPASFFFSVTIFFLGATPNFTREILQKVQHSSLREEKRFLFDEHPFKILVVPSGCFFLFFKKSLREHLFPSGDATKEGSPEEISISPGTPNTKLPSKKKLKNKNKKTLGTIKTLD
ncbi:MAG: hypothetical protein ACRCYZ_05030 [Alphaproteobacteria bacterium]